MSKPLVVVIPHSLGKEEALRRLRPGLSKAAASFPVLHVEEELWSGDQLQFRFVHSGRRRAALCRSKRKIFDLK